MLYVELLYCLSAALQHNSSNEGILRCSSHFQKWLNVLHAERTKLAQYFYFQDLNKIYRQVLKNKLFPYFFFDVHMCSWFVFGAFVGKHFFFKSHYKGIKMDKPVSREPLNWLDLEGLTTVWEFKLFNV